MKYRTPAFRIGAAMSKKIPFDCHIDIKNIDANDPEL